MEVSGQLHVPAALLLENSPVLTEYEAGWTLERRGANEKNPCPFWESNPGNPL